jgi:peptidyl-prolyl cis-trans isomerase SurA
MTDPKKISKIVESEFGYHIIQLVDRRGDKVKVRHILLKPEVSDSAVTTMLARLDSVAMDIRDGKFTFEEGATYISDDKDTRKNRGLMSNRSERGQTSKFQLQDLPSEVAKVVDSMKVGQVSAPFKMINERGKTVCAIVKLKSRVDGHKATITEDFQVMKDVVMAKRREDLLHKWVVNKIKNTYVRIGDRYKNCDFEYEGWVR